MVRYGVEVGVANAAMSATTTALERTGFGLSSSKMGVDQPRRTTSQLASVSLSPSSAQTQVAPVAPVEPPPSAVSGALGCPGNEGHGSAANASNASPDITLFLSGDCYRSTAVRSTKRKNSSNDDVAIGMAPTCAALSS